MTRAKLIKDAAKFTISGYISSVSNFISATIVRKILDPVLMGVYVELLLVFDYAKSNHLGVIDSLDRQIPYYNGKKEFEKSDEAKDAGASFSLFMAILAAILIILASYLLKGKTSAFFNYGLKIIAIMVVLQSMSTLYVTIVRAHHLFSPLSWYVIILAICDIVFKALLGIRFGLMGILWASVLTLTVGLVYLMKSTGIRFKILFSIPIRVVRGLLEIGFPLLLSGFAFMMLRSIDRIMIIAFLTKEDLGFYSIALMVHSFIFQFPNLIYTVLFPRFYETFGASKDLKEIKGFMEKPTLTFAYLFPVLIGLTVIFLPMFVHYVLPKYVQGLMPAYILLFGTFFISITNMSGYLLIALKKQNAIVLISALCVGMCALLNLSFVKMLHLGISGIALGTSVTYFLYSLFLIGYAMRQHIASTYEKVKFFAHIYLPLIWVIMICCAFSYVFKYGYRNVASDIMTALTQMIVFLLLVSPLIYNANRKTGLVSRIKNAEFKFFKQ